MYGYPVIQAQPDLIKEIRFSQAALDQIAAKAPAQQQPSIAVLPGVSLHTCSDLVPILRRLSAPLSHPCGRQWGRYPQLSKKRGIFRWSVTHGGESAKVMAKFR